MLRCIPRQSSSPSRVLGRDRDRPTLGASRKSLSVPPRVSKVWGREGHQVHPGTSFAIILG